MAFILSENRRTAEECAAAFRTYEAYLAKAKDRFPPSAFSLATSDWYFARDVRSPHDSWLQDLSCKEISSGDRNQVRLAEIQVELLASDHSGIIEFVYPKVFSYSLDGRFKQREKLSVSHGDWLWDEFTVSESGNLVHEIEWQYGRWQIEAGDVYYKWKNWNPLRD
jgi:hypothetical protein